MITSVFVLNGSGLISRITKLNEWASLSAIVRCNSLSVKQHGLTFHVKTYL